MVWRGSHRPPPPQMGHTTNSIWLDLGVRNRTAACAYQEAHVWRALLTCMRPPPPTPSASRPPGPRIVPLGLWTSGPLPPPPDQSDHRGKKRSLPSGKSGWAIFGTQIFWVPEPPIPPPTPSPASNTSLPIPRPSRPVPDTCRWCVSTRNPPPPRAVPAHGGVLLLVFTGLARSYAADLYTSVPTQARAVLTRCARAPHVAPANRCVGSFGEGAGMAHVQGKRCAQVRWHPVLSSMSTDPT